MFVPRPRPPARRRRRPAARRVRRPGIRHRLGHGGSDRKAVAAFFPLAWATEQVAGQDWEVTNLTRPGGEPHDLEMGIAQTVDLEEGAVVVFERGFQPAVDDAVDTVAEGVLVDAADAVALRSPDEQHDHDEDGADALAEDEHSADDGHDHGDTDPHFWQDPLLMADLGDAVADALAEADPDGAASYRARADDLRARLEALDAEYTTGLADCERDTVVVSHEAFGYLERYGLHFEAIAGLSPDAEPTPAVLADLEQLIAARASPPSSPSGWPRPRWPRPWRRTRGWRPPCSTPSRDRARATPRATTLLSCSRTSPLSSEPTDAEHHRLPRRRGA